MRFLAVLFLSICLGAPALAQPLSRQAFRDAYVAVLKSQKPDIELQLPADDQTRLNVLENGEVDLTAFLDNPYGDYVGDPQQLDDILHRHVRLLLGKSADFEAEATSTQLVVLLRADSLLTTTNGYEFLRRPFVGDLLQVLMIDGTETLRYATPGDIERFGLTEEAAFDLARKNLRDRIGPVDTEEVQGITVFAADSGLAAGLPTLPEFCLAGQPGKLILMAARAHFFSAPRERADVASALKDITRRMIADGASMSTTLIECQAGAWSVVSLN